MFTITRRGFVVAGDAATGTVKAGGRVVLPDTVGDSTLARVSAVGMGRRGDGTPRFVGLILGALACVGPMHPDAIVLGQQPVTLRGPAVELQEQFSRVIRVRELADGRVLVLDPADNRLVVADFASGAVAEMLRQGAGPGEFRRLSGMHALGGDSTLLDDQAARRWIILDGVRVAATVTPTPGTKFGSVAGADALGRVLDIHPFAFRRSPGVPYTAIRSSAESLAVIVRRRGIARNAADAAASWRLSPTQDTIARIRGMAAGQTIAWRPMVDGGTPIRWLLESPLATEQQAFLFPDGWIALALTDPYRVTWVPPDSRRFVTITLPDGDVRINDQIKRALLALRWPNVRPPFADGELPPWPPKLPPFLNDALTGSPEGRLVIRRTFDPSQRATLYDLVDRPGGPTNRLTLPANEHIVGFGRRAVYVVAKDSDDVETIRRYPWP